MNITIRSKAERRDFTVAELGRAVRVGAACVALATAACSDAAPARQSATAVKASTSNYSIAGVATGMSANQIVLRLTRAGYALVNTDAGNDWALEVKMASTGDKLAFGEPRRGIRAQQFKRGGERVSVDYLAMPAGPVAYLITYDAPQAVSTYPAAIAEMTRRHGQSLFSNKQAAAPWSMWCDGRPASARACLDVKHLSVGDARDGVTISMEDPAVSIAQRRLLAQSGSQRPSF